MSATPERLAYLLEAWSSRKATEEEINELMHWLSQDNMEQPVSEHVQQLIQQFNNREPVPAVDWETIYQKIEEQTADETIVIGPRKRRWHYITIAASLLVLLGAGMLYFLMPSSKPPVVVSAPKQPKAPDDVLPGSNGAMLILSNGQKIILDSAGNGMLALQGNTELIHKDGQLRYINNPGSGEVFYNTMSTARGRQYQLQLADGSKVWLNAASSITFPTSFSGHERKVSITGEAYFEVAHDAKKPFTVSVNGMEVRVLGTHFNIMAYNDEPVIKTTLLEGSVKIVNRQSTIVSPQSAIIKPGEQAVLTADSRLTIHDSIDMEEAVAWKDGLFIMKKADIGTIMRQIARWYDVDIVYDSAVPEGRISGDIPRNMNLSKVLHVMELSGVHFNIVPGDAYGKGKKVVVRP